METTIKWNADLLGVEIQTKDQHFVISAQQSMTMSWHDAVRYFEGNNEWRLPTTDQLEVVATNINEVNEIIKENGGCEIRGWHWSAYECDEFCAWYVNMNDGNIRYCNKNYGYNYVRAVSDLKN